ncbi:laccase [Lactarius akahatsu]|uniref:Laccase n=1 Tax=Lactarius akahatsu TaxID=416441 RepID=A0AAD4LIF4_9AGAM|nr:laccase [Lactarius akahatsu]
MTGLRSLAVLLATISGSVSAAIGPIAELLIQNVALDAVTAPDGFSRLATLANGGVTGPLIRGNKGDTFLIDVRNQLVDKSLDLVTSVHWHGMFQRGSNYADGGAFVNQCPIIPDNSFTYQFKTDKQAGTYWYHSHFRAQYCDGLRGPLVIYDRDDPHASLYDVDNEDTIITLADWYHYVSLQAPAIPRPNSTLINGKGRYPGGPSVPLAVVNVVREKRYRLRLVSISCDPAFTFSIDGHQLTIIEVDGENTKPLVVDSLQIFAGEFVDQRPRKTHRRTDFQLNANQPIDNYWIRAVPNVGASQDFTGLTNLAILRYLGAPLIDPSDPTTDIPPSVLPLKETDLHPGNPVPGGADININLNVSLANGKFLVDGVAFESPDVPVLLQILSGVPPSELLPKGSIRLLGGNKSVEVSIPAGALGAPHPIHLHGHAFHVVRSAGNSTYNFDSPVVRDVVSMGNDGDNVTIRFFTDNPGPWFLHCHIDWHLEKGFAVVFAEDVPDVSTTVHPSQQWDELCPKYNDFANIAA